MAEHPGVLRVNVSPATKFREIIDNSLRAVTGYSNYSFLNNFTGATRVIKWHKRIFSVPPTIVLRVRERSPDEKAASVGGAVRMLIEDYKLHLHVVIDSSDSSLESMALTTLRQRLVQVRQPGR
jgi:hypothetical protein